MSSRSASVPYSPDMPAPSGAVSQDGSGASPQSINATPESFGAPLARGESVLGRETSDVGQHLTGMVMETAANQAELESVQRSAPVIAKYKSMEGLAAQAAAPQFEKEILGINQDIRGKLPLGAQRLFDSTTVRQSAYMVRDYQTYAASQVKHAALESNNGLAESAVSRAGDLTTASDDFRFGGVIGDIKHSVASMMDLQGYGDGVTTDPETGKVTFSDNPTGQAAKNVYQSELDKRTSAAWENRLHVLSDQNVNNAYKVFQDNRDSIPGEAQVKLDAFFTPKIRDYGARDIADTVMNSHDQQYKNNLVKSGGAETDISEAIHQQESGGKAHDYQIQRGTFDQYAKPGESFDNPEDHDKVYSRIMDDLKKKFPDDPARQAVAYFSGEGNVAPSWSATPWKQDREDKTGKAVSSYVGDILKRVGGSVVASTSSVPSLADYYRSNYNDIIGEARQKAQEQHPDDPNFADLASSKVEQKMGVAIRGQELAYKADNDTVVRAFNGDFSKGARPVSVDALRATSPQASAAWDRLLVNNPMAATAIENRIITANARGDFNSSNPAGFSAAEHRIFLPSSDSQAITDEAQLWPLVANNTITGKDRDNLAKVIGDIQDPKNKMVATAKKGVIDSALNQIMPAKIRNAGFVDTETNTRIQNARSAIEAADEEAIKAGRTSTERYSPGSKYFVGNAAKQFLPTVAQKLDAVAKNKAQIPTFASPNDKGFSDLSSGDKFMTADGQIRTKK